MPRTGRAHNVAVADRLAQKRPSAERLSERRVVSALPGEMRVSAFCPSTLQVTGCAAQAHTRVVTFPIGGPLLPHTLQLAFLASLASLTSFTVHT